MFEHVRDYPAAVTADTLSWDEADRRAVQWVVEHAQSVGGQVLLWYPTARQRSEHPTLDALEGARGVVTATWRTLLRSRWTGGPVLAAWPDAQHLSEIADDRRTRALCVLTWSMEEIAPWAAAVDAEVLGGKALQATSRPALPETERRAMESVTRLVNMNNTLKAGHEKDVAGGALLILRDHGHVIDPTVLYTWAVANGWPARRAEELRDLAKQIARGSRPRVRRGMFRTDAYARWSEHE